MEHYKFTRERELRIVLLNLLEVTYNKYQKMFVVNNNRFMSGRIALYL